MSSPQYNEKRQRRMAKQANRRAISAKVSAQLRADSQKPDYTMEWGIFFIGLVVTILLVIHFFAKVF